MDSAQAVGFHLQKVGFGVPRGGVYADQAIGKLGGHIAGHVCG